MDCNSKGLLEAKDLKGIIEFYFQINHFTFQDKILLLMMVGLYNNKFQSLELI